MGRDVIIACDFNSKEEVVSFLSKFQDEKPFVKIGMELFYAEGPEIVRTIKKMGHKIFLDLKLHDIPNTVKKSMAVLSNLDVDMCNVHAAGTKAMMSAAIEGLTRADGTRPLLIAVTQLTSTSEEVMQEELWIDKPIDKTSYALCKKYNGSRVRWCGMLSIRGRKSTRSMWRKIPYHHTGRAFCRRRCRRSEACDNTCKSKSAWL